MKEQQKVHPLTVARQNKADIIEKVMMTGDLAELTAEERNEYVLAVCKSLGLNPLTRPFEYIVLNGKLRLYARRDCADQIRRLRGVSIENMAKEVVEGVYIVTVDAIDKDGRRDQSTGAVNIAGLKGEALANQMMKGETKAKRRVTLSLCGLGLIDETEVEDAKLAERKTLPKAKATPIFKQLEAEMNARNDEASLKAWWKNDEVQERIAELPADWQDSLRLEAKAKLATIRVQAGGGEQTVKEIDQVADEATRQREQAFIDEFAEACENCSSIDDLTAVVDAMLTPLRGKASIACIKMMDATYAATADKLIKG